MKAQGVRLLDVFVIGPFLVWAGYRARTKAERYALYGLGYATILYNGRNYLIERKRLQALEPEPVEVVEEKEETVTSDETKSNPHPNQETATGWE